MLNSYRKQLLALLDKPSDSNSINIGLLAKGGKNFSGEYQPWEQYNFEEQPLASAVTTLTRLQNDVKNAETSVVQKLFQSINSNTMVVDKFVPVVLPRSNYVLLPDSFRAQIFLAASSKTKNPEIIIDSINGRAVDKRQIPVEGGTGNFADRPGNEGPQSFAGTILVDDPQDPTGQKKLPFPFRSSYLAAKPSVVVSPSKMNVFYIGLDNPVDISAAGFANSDLTPSITMGSITKASGGGYVVRIPGTDQNNTTCNITVSGKMPDGSRKSLGQPQVFRIKRVPDPNCYFMNKKGDMFLSKGELNSATEVQARMDNFDFELKYEVTSFQMAMTVNGNTVELRSNTNKLTPEMKNLMGKVPKNTHINVELVHVKGPADSRTIPGVNITVN
jgi:gliding motility-associated protein GldM